MCHWIVSRLRIRRGAGKKIRKLKKIGKLKLMQAPYL